MRALHAAPAKAVKIRISRVGPNLYAMLFRQLQRALHHIRVTSMKTTGNISLINKRHYLAVEAHGPAAEAFA